MGKSMSALSTLLQAAGGAAVVDRKAESQSGIKQQSREGRQARHKERGTGEQVKVRRSTSIKVFSVLVHNIIMHGDYY